MTTAASTSSAELGPRVLHIITDLDIGGAEHMLVTLVSALAQQGLSATVLSLMRGGALAQTLRRERVDVHEIGMQPGRPDPRVMLRLARHTRDLHPDLIQTWMYHADLLGGLAARMATQVPIVWGLHNTDLDPQRTKRSTRWVVRACAALSHAVPARIVSCSDTGAALHARLGYAPDKLVSIPNGFDTEALRPNPAHRLEVRAELGLRSDAVLVGQVARFDPQKDHRSFIRAAGRLARERADVHFVLVGKGCEPGNRELVCWIGDSGAAQRFHLLGLRQDARRLLAAFDVAALSSAYGEAFPLVLGEAMACGVPCVATDVGDAARIIGDTGHSVPPGDPAALADALLALLRLPAPARAALGEAARARIVGEFSLPAVTARYARLYRDLMETRSHA